MAENSDAVDAECGEQINFLKQFRDANSRQFRKFTASQFMEVWNHYDTDSE